MKNKIICAIMICLSPLLAIAQQAPEVMKLNQGWTFTQRGKQEWRAAEVPGTVHQDLLRHELLPDPFFGNNEEKIQWVEREDWEYRTRFEVSAEQLARGGASLRFEGLDTYADVYLNGALILRADNMFVGHDLDVKSVLRPGVNRLHILFHSPVEYTRPQWESNGFNYPADNDHAERRTSVFSRKAPYSFGWDWGIRMATSGVWRPVTLTFFDAARIADYHVRQQSLTDERAELLNLLEVHSVADEPVKAEWEVTYSLPGEEPVTTTRPVTLQPGKNLLEMPVGIDRPRRWMPHGWGEPTLYNFNAKLCVNGETVAEKSHRIGLRTVRLVNEDDAHGQSYYFEVNGVPMFAKGANFIPDDCLLPSMTDERYRQLFADVKAANMNMIRVWGGGTYEDDRFYDLADENGILIWQDFMFACTIYPADPEFLKRVEAEADYNIRRLRNHACLAMWCGNNEILEGLKYWGWQKNYSKEIYEELMANYDKLFRQLLPAKVKEWDDGRSYVHGSPLFANWGRPDSWKIGDSHNWGIWYGQKTFESSDTEIGRFQSEFGFESFPEMKTIATFAEPKDYEIESEVMRNHQKSTQGNSLIRTYMVRDFRVPESFEDFVYVGLVLQGQGIRHCLEAHRRNRPYCMGTLYWQLNDSWPVVSWSSIDYYGNWKALHYQARRAFEPILLNPINEGEEMNVYLVSDLLTDSRGLKLDVELRDFDGKRIARQTMPVEVEANSAKRVLNTPIAQWGDEAQRRNRYLKLTLRDAQGRTVAQDVHFLARTKDLDLPEVEVKTRVRVVADGRCEVTLSAPRLAKDVFVQIPFQGARFDDNFFDLLPGEKRVVVITSPEIKKGEVPDIKVQHIRQTY